MIYNIRRRVPNAHISCICTDPIDTERRHGLPSFPISPGRHGGDFTRQRARVPTIAQRYWTEVTDWRSIFRILRQIDTVVMTGTGMLTDAGEGPFGLPYDIFRWTMAAKAHNRRVVFVSVGVEPIEDPLTKFFLVASLRTADYRSYRDRQSQDALARVGFASSSDAIFPDLAFSLPEHAVGTTPASRGAPSKVAVGVYNYRGAQTTDAPNAAADRSYIAKLATFIMWLLDQGYGVRVVIGDLAYDQAVLRELRGVLEERGVQRYRNRIEDAPANSVEEIIAHLAGVDLVVATRFHNVLMALYLGKPVVSISYNAKNDALMSEVGLGKFCQSIETFDVEQLKTQFTELHRRAPDLAPRLLAKSSEFRRDLDRQYAAILDHGSVDEPSEAPPCPGEVTGR
jgi:polysaccharide pyruvyl transferase WcaK-like protein